MTEPLTKAQEYRERAAVETAAGEAAGLEQVRAKHVRAAQVWTDLAEAEEAREAERAKRRAASPEPTAPLD